MENPAWQAGDRQGDGEHRLADSGWAEEDHVALVLHAGQRGQVADLARIQVGLEGEVELLEGLAVRQAGKVQRVAEPSAFAVADLLVQDEIEQLQVAQLFGLGAGQAGFHGLGRWVRLSLAAWVRMRMVSSPLMPHPAAGRSGP